MEIVKIGKENLANCFNSPKFFTTNNITLPPELPTLRTYITNITYVTNITYIIVHMSPTLPTLLTLLGKYIAA